VLGLGALTCVALSAALVGPSVVFEYLHEVLPAHALAEVDNQQQISLTYIVHHFGMPSVPAMRFGQLWYVIMLALGVYAAGKSVKRAPELVPALPVAFALFGGAFIHIVQIPAALPAALILMVRAPSAAARRSIAIATIVLALPIMHYPILYPLSVTLYPAIAVILVSTFTGVPLLPAVACAFVAGIAPIGLWALVRFPDVHSSLAPLVRAYDAHSLADVSWTRYMNVIATSDPPQLALLKVQIWLALGTILALAVGRFLGSPIHDARLASVDRLVITRPSGPP
jgi:hypothetical protein